MTQQKCSHYAYYFSWPLLEAVACLRSRHQHRCLRAARLGARFGRATRSTSGWPAARPKSAQRGFFAQMTVYPRSALPFDSLGAFEGANAAESGASLAANDTNDNEARRFESLAIGIRDERNDASSSSLLPASWCDVAVKRHDRLLLS